MSRPLIILLGLIGFAAIWFMAFTFEREGIETDLAERTQRDLTAKGFNVESVTFEGRDGTFVMGAGADLGAAKEVVLSTQGEHGFEGVRVADFGAPQAPSTPSEMTLTSANGKVTLNGVLPSEDDKSALIAKAAAEYGEENVIDEISVSADRTAPGWLTSFAGLFGPMKTSLPNGSFGMKGGDLTITGQVANATEKSMVVDAAQQVLGPDYNLIDQLTMSAAQSALNDVLSGKKIEFIKGGYFISRRGKVVVREVAAALKDFPNAVLAIEGYTDADGSPSLNKTLSQARAQSVKDYLGELGIDVGAYTVTGFGEERPIATNATPEGRASNRRVVLRVLSE